MCVYVCVYVCVCVCALMYVCVCVCVCVHWVCMGRDGDSCHHSNCMGGSEEGYRVRLFLEGRGLETKFD